MSKWTDQNINKFSDEFTALEIYGQLYRMQQEVKEWYDAMTLVAQKYGTDGRAYLTLKERFEIISKKAMKFENQKFIIKVEK
jgi:hypothetical protein